MSETSARISPIGEEVSLELLLGDGVICEWTVRLEGPEGGEAATRTWTGNTRDTLPDLVPLPASAVPSGTRLTWMAVFFGPSRDASFHYAVKLRQGDRSVLDEAIKGSGTVKARRTKVLSGSILVVAG